MTTQRGHNNYQTADGSWRHKGSDGTGYWLAGPCDTSGYHATYPTGYDPKCGWCWLGAPHSNDAHAARIAAAPITPREETRLNGWTQAPGTLPAPDHGQAVALFDVGPVQGGLL